MSTTKLRWGILGVAKINERLIPAFGKAVHAELRAIASRDAVRAEQAARAARIPIAHTGYEALLDDPTIDAIYNPLPNTLHGEWTRRAADRGKHVLCEKPLTPTAAEAQALVNYCRGKGVTLMDGFMWPHHPRTAQLRKLLDEGGVGQVLRVTGALTFPLRPLHPSNIRLQPALAGGSLLDVGCYPVYGIRWAFGSEPVRAWAWARSMHGVDIEMSGTVWMEDGRVGSFDCGFTMPLRGWLEITGTDGVITIPEMWLPGARAEYTMERIGSMPQVFTVAGEDQIVHMLDDFSRAVLNRQPVHPDPEEAVKTLRVLDALARSAREGRVVEI